MGFQPSRLFDVVLNSNAVSNLIPLLMLSLIHSVLEEMEAALDECPVILHGFVLPKRCSVGPTLGVLSATMISDEPERPVYRTSVASLDADILIPMSYTGL